MKRSLENLNIALVHDWITNVAGGERVVLALHEIFPNAPIYTSVYDPKKAKAFNGCDIRPSFLQKLPLFKGKREILTPFTPFAFEQQDLSEYDLVISSSSMAAKGVITKPDTLHVCYCHTPARYFWEPQVDPRATKGKLSWLRENVVHKMRIWDRLAADRVDIFVANSRYIADRIRKYYKREATVIYPGVDVDRFASENTEKVKDYYLFVSRLVDYKRCDLVVETFNRLGLPLKIIGKGPEMKRLKKVANQNIEFLGFVDDKNMKKYYAEAKAFVFAAEEDFGIVPIEAMAAGRPVIAFGKGGVLESVVGGETGVFFEDQTPESMITAVQRFQNMQFDTNKIRERAKQFSESRFKAEITNFLEKSVDSFFSK